MDHRTDAELQAKELATLRARLALAGGFAVHQLADGTLVVARWDCTKPCGSLEQLRSFARQVGAL
jgi:hypothetical protein